MERALLWGLAGALSATLSGCGTSASTDRDGDGTDGPTQFIKSDLARAAATPAEAAGAAADTRDFAWGFYQQIADTSKNLVYSPYSISVAAAMLSAGAAGNTLAQMETALRMSTPTGERHQSHNALSQALESRNHDGSEETEMQILRVSNDFWMSPELTPADAFLDTLAVSYDAGVHLANFAEEPDGVRDAINRQVSDDTNALIPELLPPAAITSDSVFVLTNALYFKARWSSEFDVDDTAPQPFNAIDGTTPDVDMMTQVDHFDYAEGAGYRAASLPYYGHELDLVVVMPDPGTFADFVAGLDAATMQGIVERLVSQKLDLSMPKVEIRGGVDDLAQQLIDAGMVDAFDQLAADFSPIGQGLSGNLYISKAFHEAVIFVDEEGTEAAAATAFVGATGSAPPPDPPIPFKLDHPFVFLLRDVQTNTPLFIGHYVSP